MELTNGKQLNDFKLREKLYGVYRSVTDADTFHLLIAYCFHPVLIAILLQQLSAILMPSSYDSCHYFLISKQLLDRDFGLLLLLVIRDFSLFFWISDYYRFYEIFGVEVVSLFWKLAMKLCGNWWLWGEIYYK